MEALDERERFINGNLSREFGALAVSEVVEPVEQE